MKRKDREHVALIGGRFNQLELSMVLDLVIPIPNMHPEPIDNFRVTKRWYQFGEKRCRASGRLLLGVMHSHLPHHAQRPSEGDLARNPAGLLGMVYLTETEDIYVYGL